MDATQPTEGICREEEHVMSCADSSTEERLPLIRSSLPLVGHKDTARAAKGFVCFSQDQDGAFVDGRRINGFNFDAVSRHTEPNTTLARPQLTA